jgi:hypothetical protein
MKIIINNRSFTYDIGVRLLKTKYIKCFDESLSDIWEDIVPMELKDILKLENLEDRRVGLDCLGIQKIKEQSNAELLSSKTLDKSLTWINKNGELESKTIKDTYELYTVNNESLGLSTNSFREEKLMFIKCKDTSTDREYLLWIDYFSLMSTALGFISFSNNNIISKIDALDAIAWTIQTNVPKNKIEAIVRQGDCIMIKTAEHYKPLSTPRHLTKEEYINLLTLES